MASGAKSATAGSSVEAHAARNSPEPAPASRAALSTCPCAPARPEPAGAYADRPTGKRLRWCEDA